MQSAKHYTAVAILLHWAIALAVGVNLALGWWMHEAIDSPATQARAVAAFQLHKSIGLTVLVLSLLRLGWRLLYPPPLPVATRPWERRLAHTAHGLLYLLMIALPLSGWVYVSTQWRGDSPLNLPTLWFGLVNIPHLFGLADAAPALRQAWAGSAVEAHELLAWGSLLLLLAHVVAALKHQFINRDEVLGRMLPLPGLAPDERELQHAGGRRLLLRGGSLVMVVALAAVVYSLWRAGGGNGSGVLHESAGRQAGAAKITSVQGSWLVDPNSSFIAFAGVQAGVPFRGRFRRWEADIRIDPLDPGATEIVARIKTASASDGVPLHDETLVQEEWFNSAAYPLAEYRSTGIVARNEREYELQGRLTIKGISIALAAPLTLVIEGTQAYISGKLQLDRGSVDLGMESDPGGSWVSREILVEVEVHATLPAARAQAVGP